MRHGHWQPNPAPLGVERHTRGWYHYSMKRRLIVMRHCKSSWDHPELGDHARPLNKRGRRDAPAVGRRLRDLGWMPDAAISSDAQRTRETWQLMSPEFGATVPVTFTNRLYGASATELAEVIEAQPADLASLLVLGHNPGWERFASWLAGEPHGMTTGNAVCLTADTPSWGLEPYDWTLEHFLRPREL